MNHVRWDSSLETGDERVDNEHQDLFALVNALEEAAFSPEDNVELAEIACSRMSEYAHTHFAHEESLMAQYEYPQAKQHHALHQEFAEESERLVAQCRQEEFVSVDVLAAYLYAWLHIHIDSEDRKLVEHVKARKHAES